MAFVNFHDDFYCLCKLIRKVFNMACILHRPLRIARLVKSGNLCLAGHVMKTGEASDSHRILMRM